VADCRELEPTILARQDGRGGRSLTRKFNSLRCKAGGGPSALIGKRWGSKPQAELNISSQEGVFPSGVRNMARFKTEF